MKATEFRKEQEFKYDYFSELTKTGIAPNYENIDKFAEAYHQYELKKLRVADVSGRSKLLFAFIAEIKSEFADQNWDYLDFIADRVIGKQLTYNGRQLGEPKHSTYFRQIAVIRSADFHGKY
jgi:hypothetical protein